MEIATLTIAQETVTVRITTSNSGDAAFYAFDEDPYNGAALVYPARVGLPPRYGVGVTFSGYEAYDGCLMVGDWALVGSVLCRGPEMRPGPYPDTDRYPIGGVRKDDPQTADVVAELASVVAAHYVEHYQGSR